MNLDFHLEQFYRYEGISFHYFDDFDELVTICKRFRIDAVIIGGRGSFDVEIELIRAIKSNVFMSIVPVVLYNPDPDPNQVVAAYESGAEDFIFGDWKDRLVQVRIRSAIERNRRDLSINPSTRLPGPAMIDRELSRQLQLGEEFAVCYADLDNFKAYNDYYGYHDGDKVVRLTAMVIRDVVFDLCKEGFVGHIAGDDFIAVVPCDLAPSVCDEIIRAFDAVIPYKYALADRERGHITTTSRRGEVEDFPILTISIAVTENRLRKFKHVGEMSQMLADLKKVAKAKEGSNWVLERRAKY